MLQSMRCSLGGYVIPPGLFGGVQRGGWETSLTYSKPLSSKVKECLHYLGIEMASSLIIDVF